MIGILDLYVRSRPERGGFFCYRVSQLSTQARGSVSATMSLQELGAETLKALE